MNHVRLVSASLIDFACALPNNNYMNIQKPTAILIVMLLLGSSLVAGCATSINKWNKHVDNKLGFSFEYPSDWHITEKPISKGVYQDYLALTNFRLVRSYSDTAPHLNYPDGGISIVLHWKYAPGDFPQTSNLSETGKRSVELKSLGKRGYVNRMTAQVPPPYIAVHNIINGRDMDLELRTDKEGRELGEKVFERVANSFAFKNN